MYKRFIGGMPVKDDGKEGGPGREGLQTTVLVWYL